MSRADYPVLRTVPTRWSDNDVYGHVNNVVYYSWFDTAVNALLVELGLLDLGSGATISLIVENGCRYHRSVAFPEPVEAGIRIGRLGTSSVRWELAIFTAGNSEPAAEGFLVHVCVDRASRRPVALPDVWRAKLAPLTVWGT